VVEVPEDARNFRIGKSERLKGNVFYNTTLDYFAGSQVIELGSGTYQIICTLKDATYTQAAEIVEHDGDGFKDYNPNNFHFDLPLMSPFDSLRSLFTAKGCDLNNNYLIIKKG
jgi:hypothetical protein